MKRTTTLLMAITMLIFMVAATNVWGQSFQPQISDYEIWREVQRIGSLNPQIKDLDKINVGDTIIVDASNGKTIYIVEPWATDGQLGDKGCLWKIAGTYLFGNLRTIPPTAPTNSVETETVPIENGSDRTPNWVWILVVVVIMLAILIMSSSSVVANLLKNQIAGVNKTLEKVRDRQETILRQQQQEESRRLTENERRLNQDSWTPMLAGGLDDNPEIAINQITRISDALFMDPNRTIKKAERGYVTSDSQSSFIAPVWNKEGIRDIRIEDGTSCYRVTVGRKDNPEYSHIEYWLQHCGNLVAEIASGRFELPEGWAFIVDTDDKKNPIQATAEPEIAITPIVVSKEPASGSEEENLGSVSKHRITIVRECNGSSKLEVSTSRYPTQIDSRNDGSYTIDLL